MNYTFYSESCRSYIDHVLVSEWIYNNITSCSILPHNTDNMSDHLPLKVIFNISCDKVRVTNDKCNGRVASIPRIDWSKETNRIKYLNCLNKKSEYIDKVNIDLCGNAETAQILVKTMNQQIVNCIQDAYVFAAGKQHKKQ